MITLSATIKLLEGDSDQISTKHTNITKNNNSAKLPYVIGSNAKSSNPFLLGTTKLGQKATLSSKVPFFISQEKSNENGYFEKEMAVQISYSNSLYTDYLNIVFDTFNNQYATEIYIDGVLYANDDPFFTVGNLPENAEKKIVFAKWNVPYMPLKIESISLGLTINIDRNNLLSYNGNIKSRSNIQKPSWGIISNVGNISFNDTTGEILDYANGNLLVEGNSVIVNLINTITKKSQKVGTFLTDVWDYDNDNRQVSVSLKDDLTEWQDINVEGINYVPTISTEQNFEWVYKVLYQRTPSKYNLLAFNDLDESTKNQLSKSYIKFPIMSNSSLWSAWTKFCEATQTYIYKNQQGETVCVYKGGD